MAVNNCPDRAALVDEINRLRRQRNAVIMAHYYQEADIQDLADCVGDSLALAREARRTDAEVIVVCGVHFMGETAKLLNPDKTVIVPDASAGCSLADSCPASEFEEFIARHPGHLVVSYVNTSAAVKALTDIVVTSGNALRIVESLPKDQKIIFGPDRNLGNYINSLTGRQMVLWPGACHVHEQFSLEGILQLKEAHPNARLLVHPECPAPIRMLADVTGSTAALLDAVRKAEPASEFIVATESGILHGMRHDRPDCTFFPAPPRQAEGSLKCGACNECSFMRLNTLEKLRDSLRSLSPAIEIDPAIADRALRPIERMLALS